MTVVRVGVVGCGMIAQLMHLPYLVELAGEFAVTAVCDLDRDLAAEVAARFGVPGVYGSVAELLDAGQVDAVLVLTQDHFAPAAAALERGVHTFTEKPLCHTLREGEALVETAERTGAVLMVGLMKRYDSGVRQGLAAIRGLREPALARSHVVVGPHYGNWIVPELHTGIRGGATAPGPDPRRDRVIAEFGPAPAAIVDAYMDMFGVWSHDINLLRAAFPTDPHTVRATASPDGTALTATLDHPGGLHCVFQGGSVDVPLFDEGLAVWSREAVVELTITNPFLRNTPSTVRTRHAGPADGTTRPPLVDTTTTGSHDEAFRAQLRHFHHCVTTGSQPLTSGREALADTRLMLAILRAANDSATGRR
ncbi:Gfo/Idh/MocA family protein [Saccharothrix lopnurensis]|uniref:Gfo/Idh/MocA family protein n=1 Tax=Saccharothrix lopnurensis TaxID=1670621 RepID=A0ABW1PC03_9PSEU